MVKLKYILFDFLNFAFLLFLVGFCIFYFVAGDRFFVFTKILQFLMPLSILGIIFLLKLKFNHQQVKKYRKEINFDEAIMYFTKTHFLQDWVVVCCLPLLIISIALLNKTAGIIDVVQAFLAFGVGWSAHFYLFRKHRDAAVLYFASRLDKLLDEIIIFLLPIIIYSVALFQVDSVLIDMLQAIVPFMLMYLWRKYLFTTSEAQ